MAYWLLKSEPDVFSIDDLAKAPGKRTAWDGVRNYLARNNMRAMREGDLALFYHSNASPPAAVGVVEVVREAYPDPSQFDPKSRYHDPKSRRDDPRWSLVDVKLARRLPRPVTLAAIKADRRLAEMALVKTSRLSVQPVTAREWKAVLELGGETP